MGLITQKIEEPEDKDKSEYYSVMNKVENYMQEREFDKKQNVKLIDNLNKVFRNSDSLSDQEKSKLRNAIISMERIGMARRFK